MLSICSTAILISCIIFKIGITGGSIGGESESLSRDRLVYLTTCLIGHHVEVQVTNGSVFSGIFHASNADGVFGTSHISDFLKCAENHDAPK